MRLGRISLAVLSLLLALAPASSLLATSYVVVADAPLADQADLIVTAEIAGQKVSSETGRVMTHYTVLVEDLIKGEIAGSGLEVRVLGGMDEETGHFLKIWGSPSFRARETVLLFLGRNDDGSYHVMHMLLGAFHRLKSDGQSFWVRSIEDEHVVASAPGVVTAALGTERDGQLFVEWLRARANGSNQTTDYYREVPEDTSLMSEFTLITGSNDIIRWFNFDDGEKVIWKLHKKGHKAIPTKGKRQSKGAFKILNKATERPGATLVSPVTTVAKPNINLVLKGKSKSKQGFDGFDGLNVILGADFGDWISNNFSCSTGGVLAIGGISAAFTQNRAFRNKQVIATAETELVINDGTDCFYKQQGVFANRVKGAEEVYLHEFMHTLGIGHTCGDDSSPKCSKSARAADSNMAATVHGDGAHAMGLGTEDLGALQFLYTSDAQAPVPSKKVVPGSKKFCKKVKGCGEGQGNCKNNSQCNGGLICKTKVGAQFGLPAKTNVCTST